MFTDDAAERLLDRISRDGRAKPAPEMGPILAGQWNRTLANIAQGFELRLAGDLLTPRSFRRGLLFAGTERAAWISFDDGSHWRSLQLNLPNSPVHDLVVKDDDLVVATHGRSFWVLDDITPLRQMKPAAIEQAVALYPVKDALM